VKIYKKSVVTTGKVEPFVSLVSFISFIENQGKIRNFRRLDRVDGSYLNFRRSMVGPMEVKITSVGLLYANKTWGLYPHAVACHRLTPPFLHRSESRHSTPACHAETSPPRPPPTRHTPASAPTSRWALRLRFGLTLLLVSTRCLALIFNYWEC
jgi:hypothetical protein